MAARVTSESARRVSGCVTALLREQPFFGSLALRLPIRADATRETVASDGREIRYSPRWVAEAQAHVIETAMARVVLACALKHHTRRGQRDPERWQRASQLVTHGLLRDAGFTLPPDAEAWDGISVEQAYDRLPEPEPDDGDGNNDAPSGGGAAGADSAGTPPSPDSGGDDDSGGSDDESGDSDPQDADGQDTDPGADAPPSCDPAGTGEVMDAPAEWRGGRCRPVPVRRRRRRAGLGRGHAPGGQPRQGPGQDAGRRRGDGPGRACEHRRLADAAAPLHDGRRRRATIPGACPTGASSTAGSTCRRSARRASTRSPSSSTPRARCRPQTLAEFWAEVREIASELQPERVILLQVDAAVQDAAEYAAADLPDEIAIRGRGGTDFRPGFAWLEEHDIRPGVCLYLTDMLCSSYPETEPGYPVCWVNYGQSPGDWNREPWGERIDIAAS